MLASTLGAAPLLTWTAPRRWSDAIAVVRAYSPNGTPTTVVSCWNGFSIVYAVAQAHPADTVKVCARQLID